MDNISSKLGSDSQESQDVAEDVNDKPGPSLKPITLGVQNAKKKLRAFSIQKKSSMSPVAIPKPLSTGSATVFIGKLASVKTPVHPKPPEDPEKKVPKPPKPGTSRQMTDSYIHLRKNTLDEIEDMKRKMELVELGIPLGLICPAPNSVTANKAMPTKAMPPIKSFLDPAKVDEIIREAKKAKAEGREFKFNYNKFVPDYANPFQRNKQGEPYQPYDKKDEKTRGREKYGKRSDKYDSRRSYGKQSDKDGYRDRYKDRPKERDDRNKEKESKQRDKSKDKEDRSSERSKDIEERSKERGTSKDRDAKYERKESMDPESEVNLDAVTKEALTPYKDKEGKETDVNLKDFLVCDSWSLDNDDKSKDATPKHEEPEQKTPPKAADPLEKLRHNISRKSLESPANKPKMEKLKPVMDSFKYEIEDDEILDMFDETTSLDKFSQSVRPYRSPDMKSFDLDSKETSIDELADDKFLESVINEIKSEAMDESCQDKGLVEYESPKEERMSVTPELDSSRMSSSRSDYSDGYKSVESGYKSTESGYKSTESGYKSTERTSKLTERGYKSPERIYKSPERSYKSPEMTYSPESYKSPERTNKSERYKCNRSSLEKVVDSRKLTRCTVDSLETWDFVLKVCQPLLFRHDKNRCYKETRNIPKVWFSENPKLCDCIKDRSTVYEELELAKMELVDTVYACDQMPEAPFHTARGWYPSSHQCLVESSTVQPSTEWEAEDSQLSPSGREISLDREYHRFMKAVWPEAESKSATPRGTPTRGTPTRSTKPDDVREPDEPRPKKTKLSSEGWSQESDVDEESERKKLKVVKEKRKRKLSASTFSESEVESKKRKKSLKKKDVKKAKPKSTKHLSKKGLKKLKEKHKKKKKVYKIEESDEGDHKKEKKKRDKKTKKKTQKQKKKNFKKKKSRKRSTSTSETSEDSEFERKKSGKKKKKRRKSTSESTQSDEVFDVNILNNIKTERLTDDEEKMLEFTKHREIINVKELQNDFVGNNSIQIKKEEDEQEEEEIDEQEETGREKVDGNEEVDEREEIERDVQNEKSEIENESPVSDVTSYVNLADIKIPDDPPPTPQLKRDESSQDTQDSAPSKVYEKDESHLRPSSQNSNYSFQGVMQSDMYQKELEMERDEGNYEGNYDMYEQMAMEYQSDVATQRTSPQRIETVVRSRARGEIKCDWRAGDNTAATDSSATPQRPSRWGLKPSEVNIVLTGGSEHYPIPSVVTSQPVYKIQSIANNRNDNSTTGYDEAYQDMYGAADKLQYGDCFNAEVPPEPTLMPTPVPSSGPSSVPTPRVSTLDDRINRALRTTVLSEVAKEPEEQDADKENVNIVPEPTGPAGGPGSARGAKRVSFADGYKPGQDSDTEQPPKKKKARRVGCAWPCPAAHPDHVPLWDALPPPPPPPGDPPRPAPHPAPHAAPHPHRLMPPLMQLPHNMRNFDPNMPFMPPEPPPGILNF